MSFEFRPDPTPLVVHDYYVLAWDIYNSLKRLEDVVPEDYFRKCAKALWALKINRGPDCLSFFQGYRVIIVADKKFESSGNYWRQSEIKNDVRIELAWEAHFETKRKGRPEGFNEAYKGNRSKDRPAAFGIVDQEGYDYCSKYFPFYSYEGFEADDIASAIYRRSRDFNGNCRERQIFLHTIDRDWSQLVDEEHQCFMANTRYPRANEKIQHRLIDEEAVLAHTLHKHGMEIDHPRDLIKVKTVKGDDGDNLPPGAPVEYMCLINSHPKYCVEDLPIWPSLLKDLEDLTPNQRLDHYDQSLRGLDELGLVPRTFVR